VAAGVDSGREGVDSGLDLVGEARGLADRDPTRRGADERGEGASSGHGEGASGGGRGGVAAGGTDGGSSWRSLDLGILAQRRELPTANNRIGALSSPAGEGVEGDDLGAQLK
jgi:hypothetical protein